MKLFVLALLASLSLGASATPARGIAYKTCWNNSVIPWNKPCPSPRPKGVPATKAPTPTTAPPIQSPAPTPVPMPMPMPDPTPAPVPPSLDEPPAIPTTDFDVMTAIEPEWRVVPTNAPDNVGALRFICGPGKTSWDDSIVHPGQPGTSHLHQEFGGTMTAYSTYESSRASGGSTCNDLVGREGNPLLAGKAANRTDYWVPAMKTGLLDPTKQVLVPDYFGVYYKREPVNSVECQDKSRYPGGCKPIPRGLKMVFGNDPSRPSFDSGIPQFLCASTSGGEVVDYKEDMSGAFACAIQKANAAGMSYQVISRLQSPDCWSGKIDSPDHRSHLAYQFNTGLGYFACDASHPYHIPFFLEAETFSVHPGDDVSKYHFSSDEMDMTKPPGWSSHGDYGPMAWDPIVMALVEEKCFNALKSCQGGEIATVGVLKGAAVPFYNINGQYVSLFENPNRFAPLPPHP